MARRITKRLQEAVRKLSYKTTVDQLKRRGVRRVNVLGLDRIVALIEAAVSRALKNRLQGFVGIEGLDDEGAIVEETRDEFLRMLRSNEALEQAHAEVTKEKGQLEEEVDRMRRDLQRLQSLLDERQEDIAEKERIRDAQVEESLTLEIEELFERASGSALKEQLLNLVHTRLEVEREHIVEIRAREHDEEVDLLQRRITKLGSHLKATEEKLGQAMGSKGIDPGISSVYREVQGISPDDALYNKKRSLMASIFEANLKLRNRNS